MVAAQLFSIDNHRMFHNKQIVELRSFWSSCSLSPPPSSSSSSSSSSGSQSQHLPFQHTVLRLAPNHSHAFSSHFAFSHFSQFLPANFIIYSIFPVLSVPEFLVGRCMHVHRRRAHRFSFIRHHISIGNLQALLPGVHDPVNACILHYGASDDQQVLKLMGNTCSGPNLGGRGFLGSVSAAIWRNRPPGDRLPPPLDGGTSSQNTAYPSSNEAKGSSLPSTNPAPVQNTPPEPMKIPASMKITASREPKEVAVEPEKTAAAEPERPSKPVEEAKPKKPAHMKRISSAGLQVESVLGRKTGNLKEIYSLGRKLGQGQFGTTFLCIEKATGKEFACKTIAKRKLTTQEDVEDVRREIRIMHHMAGHANIISIVDAFEDAVAVHLVMELCAGGELFDRIIQRGHYTERKAAELARVIVGVVEACHSLGVLHRDLKPENFLFINHEEEAPIKTIDFGLSVFFRPGETFTDVVGSPYYVAPEVLRKYYGPECDVWSAGVIIYILLSGVPPFWDETEQGIFEQVLKGELDFVSEPWPSISEGAKDLVRRMLVRDPKKRLTAHEVLCHPWIQIDGVAPDKPLDSAVLSRLKQFSAMDKLKKIAIRVMAEILSEEEIAGLKEMFKMIDTDNSGQITLEELKIGLEKVGTKIKESEINSLMKAADIDNSGTIDYGEFVAAMLHLNKVQREDHLHAAFSYFDEDGSGYITKDELQQACKKFGLEDIQLEELMNEVDQDNDGRIDYSEFVAMMQDGGFDRKALL